MDVETHAQLVAELREDVADFWQPLQSIARVDTRSLSPLAFYRQYVSKSVPVILTHAMESEQWQHVRTAWQDDEYLVQQAGDGEITVDITPFGYGDAVLELDRENELFVMPEERRMTLREFFRVLNDREGFDGVPYLSHQNDSLRDEFPRLYAQVPPCIELGKEAFGNDPDAVNIWIGDERAVSTMHKDHYENMYCVVKGRKHFTLLPPSDVACLYEREYPSARYRHESTLGQDAYDEATTAAFHSCHPEDTSWFIVPSEETGMTPWIPVDPLRINIKRYPLADHLNPLQCVVEAGETLYLPAMWYHRATQLCPTISVNYWHDMDFDCRYVYYNYVHRVAKAMDSGNKNKQS
ncbi:hypothetical protein Poli38472_012611 [Pythium oligandrum]|uniref:JmjC domain-containing protein n=1 Tax=Pythium oligandrum TaxID=41045 RepID=A0A8K1CDY8_PYTOL|nr:hypothetical protein Poli38472_012611 [Pythium oligandrum]|eukprot:TMW61420.1 hypothetical protein Poli38472_012611 [Pythium oligandrum]